MKLKKLRLVDLSKRELSQKQMRQTKAGNKMYDWCLEQCGIIKPPLDEMANSWYSYFYE